MTVPYAPVQIGIDATPQEASDTMMEYLSMDGKHPVMLEYIRVNPDRNEIQIKSPLGLKVVIRSGVVTLC